jgi:ribonuclease BN (tRNA processing enzyme)
MAALKPDTIILLGTSSGFPHPERSATSLLVTGSSSGMLIDAGEGCAAKLLNDERMDQEIHTIFLTHNHADHVSGLPFLLQGMKGKKRQAPLELFAPRKFANSLPDWLAPVRLAPHRLPFEVLIRPIEETRTVTASGHNLTAWLNDHMGSDPGSEDVCYGVTLHLSGGDWVFSSDLASVQPLSGKLDGVSGLIADSSHVEPKLTSQLAAAAGVSRTILTHVAWQGSQSPEPPPGPAEYAYDGMVINTMPFEENDDD